jgi:hypothetical protein
MRTAGSFFANVGFFLTLTSSVACAGESAVSLMSVGMPSACAEYAANVSNSEGNFSSVSPVVNGTTCYGAFQFCNSGTFQRFYKGTPQQFLSEPSAQVNAWLKYQRVEWVTAQKNGLTSAIGKEVCYNGTCARLTQSSILKACQFGCGKGGKLDNLVNSGMNCNAPGTADGAGTSVCRYLVSGSGYDVSCITNSNDGTNCINPGTRS